MKINWWFRLTLMTVLFVCVGKAGGVKAYKEQITMPTWEIGPPEVHSIFPDTGRRIYPYTLNEVLTSNKVDKEYNGVILENDFIKVLILPEIGGRFHGAIDKTNDYIWMYWQRTIKPGLIGQTGAWISGGIEWNFPHGHRPSGFMPVDHRIVNHPDGSATVWVGETEPIFQMRWLVGMTVYPDRSYVRCDYVFINPTNYTRSFMFWATSATHANDYAQAQYPGDMVTGHGKRRFWNWPIHDGVDLTWWKNTPNATSYFAFNNPSEWFGTYDHEAQGGMVHVANVHIMPGKKLFTWGSGPSGRIWDDILSEGGGPYFEPQAGAWSDNQPDYHWIAPHEVKTAHDFWYPVRDTRGFQNANQNFAVNTDLRDGKAFAGVYSTGIVRDHKVVLTNRKSGAILSEVATAISPDKTYTVEIPVGEDVRVYDLHLAVFDAAGNLAIELQKQPPKKVELPIGQRRPGDPKEMKQDELYRSGEWLDRFRRTDQALEYYTEALARDPKDARVNADMGFLALRQGRWEEALKYLETALERDGDNSRLYFGRGIAYVGLHDLENAYKQFYRATYTYDYFSAAYLNLARIDMHQGNFRAALKKLEEAESQNGKLADIQGLKAAAWRHLGDRDQALAAADKAMKLDAMHPMGSYERSMALRSAPNAVEAHRTWRLLMRDAAQNYLELAVAYAISGLYREADNVLQTYAEGKPDTSLNPMVSYLRGYFKELAGDSAAAAELYGRARKGPAAYTNPHRLEAKAALEAALRQDPTDAKAHLFLGNLLYANGQREAGFANWKRAVELDEKLTLAWRNVGYAQRYLQEDLPASYEAYQRAAKLDPNDARVLLELDEVAEAKGVSSEERLARLEALPDVVNYKDALVNRLVGLRLERGTLRDLELTHSTLSNHHFHSWEGKYGIHHAWVEVNQKLGDIAFEKGDFETALQHYQDATLYPKNLEVAARTPDFRAHVFWYLAKVYQAMGKTDTARDYLSKIVSERYGTAHLGTYYQALAQKALGSEKEYRSLLSQLEREARTRTSGQFEYRGEPEAIGHYLLSLVLSEKGKSKDADKEREQALQMSYRVSRLAIREAQLDLARAHQ
jgi:tetratricopeptide (TPR) repeat protein